MVGASVLFAATPIAAQQAESRPPTDAEPLAAVITQVRGDVIVGGGLSTSKDVYRAQTLQGVRAGAEIVIPQDAELALVCSNDHHVQLRAAQRWSLTSEACAKGELLPAGTYRRLVPRGGRLFAIDGILQLEPVTRPIFEHDPLAPVLLAPRNTRLREARPRLEWTRVPSAYEYEIAIVGLGMERVLEGDAGCRAASVWGKGFEVCSVPFPASFPDLEPGRVYLLSVGARNTVFAPLRQERQEAEVERCGTDDLIEIAREEGIVATLDLPAVARARIEAAQRAENQLFSEAIESYQRLLALDVTGKAWIALADLYLAIGLTDLATHSYEIAFEQDDIESKAAAMLGFGLLRSAGARFDEAEEWFQRAVELYKQTTLEQELATAKRLLLEAQSRGHENHSILLGSPSLDINVVPKSLHSSRIMPQISSYHSDENIPHDDQQLAHATRSQEIEEFFSWIESVLGTRPSFEQVEPLLHQAAQYAIAESDFQSAGTLFSELGDWHVTTDQPVYALSAYEQAEIFFLKSNALLQSRLLRLQITDLRLTLEGYEITLKKSRSIENKDARATALYGLGMRLLLQFNFDLALSRFEEALTTCHNVCDSGMLATLLSAAADSYAYLGNPEESLHYYEQSLLIYIALGSREYELKTRLRLTQLFGIKGRFSEATEHLIRADFLANELNAEHERLEAIILASRLLQQQGQYPEAIAKAALAFEHSKQLDDDRHQAEICHLLGTIYFQTGELNAALTWLTMAREREELIDDPGLTQSSIFLLGMIMEKSNREEDALKYYHESASLAQSIHGRLRAGELLPTYSEVSTRVFDNLIALLARMGRVEESFEIMENSRSQMLTRHFAGTRNPTRTNSDLALHNEETELQLRLRSLKRSEQSNEAPTVGTKTSKRDGREEGIDKTRRQLESVRLRRLIEQSRSTIPSPYILDLLQVQNLLPDDVTLIAYYCLPDKTLAWVVDSKRRQLVHLKLNAEQLAATVSALNSSISRGDFDRKVSSELYEEIFAPLRSLITTNRLLIVPHRALHELSFAALLEQKNCRFLIEDYEIANIPTASVLLFTRDRNAIIENILILGDSDTTLDHATLEVRAIARRFEVEPLVGSRATESVIHENAARVDLLHIAGHGEPVIGRPLFSKLRLAQDQAHDGDLEVHEILDLTFSELDLVVLSACESNIGKIFRDDDVISLSRAFLLAGANATISSIWQVEDKATAKMMETFYRHLLQPDVNIAGALRAAQLEMMAHKSWHSPIFWAGFVFNGHPDTSLSLNR